MTPAEVAARLDARWPEWAVSFGASSHQFVAMYVGSALLPEGLETMIASQSPERIEAWMATVQAASWRARGMPRSPLPDLRAAQMPTTARQEASTPQAETFKSAGRWVA
ncbi:hypothetical protein [Actinomadura macrotermitis]|uniref:Uncharacterized protein n=1 Tax=Actinomadura macrotermitis TaxID=2585200 RepID=A0A7K0BY61_9ACTN|nr:hypothetical protein [Actinomadura macrotermitis]MQY06130.1 hypothetical protein [Actinomadura macrotermitis]